MFFILYLIYLFGEGKSTQHRQSITKTLWTMRVFYVEEIKSIFHSWRMYVWENVTNLYACQSIICWFNAGIRSSAHSDVSPHIRTIISVTRKHFQLQLNASLSSTRCTRRKQPLRSTMTCGAIRVTQWRVAICVWKTSPPTTQASWKNAATRSSLVWCNVSPTPPARKTLHRVRKCGRWSANVQRTVNRDAL